MVMSRPIPFLLLVAAVALVSGPTESGAQTTFDIEGKYELIKPAQPTETPGKVEVIDVFWFGCPHCYRFLPVLEAYEDSKPDYVEIRHMPAIFRNSWVNHARAFYTARALGVEEKIYRSLFEAIHRDRKRLETKEALRSFFESHGVTAEDFDQTWDSFTVESGINKSRVMQGRYGITGTPSVIVNGKYRVTGSLAGSYQNMVKVVAALADKERNEAQAAQ